MSPQVREVLDAVLGEDDIARLRQCGAVLRAASTTPRDELERALDELLFLVDIIDNALLLQRMGILRSLIALLAHAEPTVRAGAAWVLSTAMQNNPPTQRDFIDAGGLEPLVAQLRSDPCAGARTKALAAVSAFLAGSTEHFRMFRDLHGCDILRDLLRVPDGQHVDDADMSARRKAVFLLGRLAGENAELRQLLLEEGFIAPLCDQLQLHDRELREHTLSALAAFLLGPSGTGDADARRMAVELMQQCGLPSKLDALATAPIDLDDAEEVREAACRLLAQLATSRDFVQR